MMLASTVSSTLLSHSDLQELQLDPLELPELRLEQPLALMVFLQRLLRLDLAHYLEQPVASVSQ